MDIVTDAEKNGPNTVSASGLTQTEMSQPTSVLPPSPLPHVQLQ